MSHIEVGIREMVTQLPNLVDHAPLSKLFKIEEMAI
jgi:hypothetical protein